MTTPFRLAELPEALQAPIVGALESGLAGDALDAIEEYFDDGGERTAELLFATAWLEKDFMFNVMVDEVTPRATRALALVAEATDAGLDTRRSRALRRMVQEALDESTAQESYLDGLDLEKATVSELADMAYRLSDKGGIDNWRRAAELFERVSEARGGSPHHWYTAAMCWCRAGDFSRAEERLLALTEGEPDPWMKANRHFVGSAWLQRLLVADQQTFEALWPRAVAGKETDFPVSQPGQDALLAMAWAFQHQEAARHLIRVMGRRRKFAEGTPEIRAKVKEWLKR